MGWNMSLHLEFMVEVYLVRVQLETEAGTTLLDDRGTDIGGHDQQCVLEIHSTTLAVCESPIFEDLCHTGTKIRLSTAIHSAVIMLHALL